MGHDVVVRRIFAVIAAFAFVGAVAIAALAPPGIPLGHLLFSIDRRLLDGVQAAQHALPAWAWDWAILPVLVRPAWLLPVVVGVVATGLSVSWGSKRPEAERSRRPRSR